MKSVLSIWGLIAVSALLLTTACSKQDNFNPAPAAQNPNPLPGAGSFSSLALEQDSPGIPLNAQNYAAAMQALNTNFRGYGTAQAQAQNVINYIVTLGVQPQFQPTPGNQPNLPLQTYQIEADGDYVTLASPAEGYDGFTLCLNYDLYGKILYTTDQVALFVSGSRLLKVFYASPNPGIAMYEIEAWGGNYGQLSLNVLNVSLATNLNNHL